MRSRLIGTSMVPASRKNKKTSRRSSRRGACSKLPLLMLLMLLLEPRRGPGAQRKGRRMPS